MLRRLSAVFCSVVLLAAGWLGIGGFSLLAALIPLLWISDSYDASLRSWWKVFGWALLTFVLWNAATVWWIWNATPVGPVAATVASSFLNMTAFMLYHTVAKHSARPLACILLIAAWITTEYWYTVGEFSFPWLILGNGFCEVPWAVQWYEYTGVFGGSLWVLSTNVLLYEALRQRRKALVISGALAAVLPVICSLVIFFTYSHHLASERIRVSVVQPNVDCYDKFHGNVRWQESNLLDLLDETPDDVQFIAMPETALTNHILEPYINNTPVIDSIASLLRRKGSGATVVTGANTWEIYPPAQRSATARYDSNGYYYDLYNSAVAITADGAQDIYHKSRLVIGVEKTPLPKLFEWLSFLVIDLGGTVGQIGVGDRAKTFVNDGVNIAPAICYEALYGDYMGAFVREGAEAMLVISNDGWWGDTPGYKRLFAFCRLRAIEHRRAIARSANTGISGFIDERGCDGQRLGWDERGVLTGDLSLNSRQTLYTRYGDYIGRIAQLVMMLSLLGFFAKMVRNRLNSEGPAAPEKKKKNKKR